MCNKSCCGQYCCCRCARETTISHTQKARGLYALRQMVEEKYLWDFRVIQRREQIPTSLAVMCDANGAAFARPCPTVPRHGFVDSRIVRTVAEAERVFDETLAADHAGEMLLMPPIKATGSAVITPTQAVYGSGNDGATAGAQGTITLPLAGLQIGGRTRETLQEAGITDDPYVEVVYDSAPHIVQLRNGPAAPRVSNFIPQDVMVTRLIECGADLLAYEKAVLSAETGAVVWQAGGNLASHYAAHAIMRGVPYITDEEPPKVGDILRANAETQEYSVRAFQRGVGVGLSRSLPHASEFKRDIGVLLLATHHATVAYNAVGSFAVGYAAALMVRYGIAACLGEARHAKRQGLDRDAVYTAAFRDGVSALRQVKMAYRLFRDHDWSSGYGGEAWRNCTAATVTLEAMLRAAFKVGTQQAIREVIAALHTAVNQAHNGGWWLNKFTSKSQFDMHAACEVVQIAKDLPTLAKAFKQEVEQGVIAAWLGIKMFDPEVEDLPRLITFREHEIGGHSYYAIQIGKPAAYEGGYIDIGGLTKDDLNMIKTLPQGLGLNKNKTTRVRIAFTRHLPRPLIAKLGEALNHRGMKRYGKVSA